MLTLNDIKEKYSVFFPEKFYFECDPGWAPILNCLMIAISHRIEFEYYRDKKTPYDQWVMVNPDEYSFKIHQIKEKFGGLRFYYSVKKDSEIFGAMVAVAELLSQCTCEITGNPGELYVKNGFIKTLSPEKAQELGYKKQDR